MPKMIERNTQGKVWVIDSYGIFPLVDFSIYGAGGWIGCLYKHEGVFDISIRGCRSLEFEPGSENI